MESDMEPSESNDLFNKHISINVLRYKTLQRIYGMLDPIKIIRNKKTKDYRDWRGLSTLCGIEKTYHDSILKNNKNQTKQVLELWKKTNPELSTLSKLLIFFEELDRFDIIDDVTLLIYEDLDVYGKSTSSKLSIKDETPFDGHLLYVEEDAAFANQVIYEMQSKFGLRLSSDLDLSSGDLKRNQIIDLMCWRNNCIIAILSEAFLKDAKMTEYLTIAYSISLDEEFDENPKKVILCAYNDIKKSSIPMALRGYHMIELNNVWYNFWEKLDQSLKTPRNTKTKTNENRVALVESQSTQNESNPSLCEENHINNTVDNTSDANCSNESSGIHEEQLQQTNKNKKWLQKYFRKKKQ